MIETVQEPGSPDKIVLEDKARDRGRRRLLGSFIVALWGVAAIYGWQFDAFAGLTMVPAWLWLIPGGILILLVRPGTTRRLWFLHFLSWLAFGILCVPETPGVIRSIYKASDVATKEPHLLRVVSFNTAAENGWAEEIKKYQPDIILVQECGSQKTLDNLGQELFGEDYAIEFFLNVGILSRGKKIGTLEYKPWDYLNEYVHATFEVSTSRTVDIVSCRLDTPIVRYDFWSSEFWRHYSQLRQTHRSDLEYYAFGDTHLTTGEKSTRKNPLILGGDFNAPARDGCVKTIRSHLVDTFEVAGIGAGNTGPSRMPIHRVDQIWVSRDWRIVRCIAVPMAVSDHRMVLCDLEWIDAE